MTTNITKLRPDSKPATPRATPTRKNQRNATRHQLMGATAIGAVAVTLTALSLNHLASGIEAITQASPYQAWAMAIGVDCAFVACELAQLTINDKLRIKLSCWFRPAILGTLAWSAVLNALAFCEHASATGSSLTMQGVAIALGISIPALVYALTKIGAAIYLDAAR